MKNALVAGTLWVTFGEVLAGAASLAGSVVAARVLDPRDFGVMGVITLAIAVLESLTASGFQEALVQKQRDVKPLLDVAWTWHVARGVALALLLCAASPLIARFYDEPGLAWLLAVSSVYVVLHGFHNIGTVLFSRALDFRTQFGIKAAQTLFSLAVYIPAVLVLRNVWALVVGFVGGALIGLVVSYVAQPYRPRLEWNREKLRELLGYGKWITGMTLIGFVITQGDDVFVSKYLGLTALGYYQLAYSISNLPATRITHVLSRVSFPTYARLQGDVEALRRAFSGVMRTTMLITGPVSVVIWIFVPDFVNYVIGAKWQAIVPLVRILVIAGFVRSFAAIAGALFQALGRPDLDLKMNLPRFIATIAFIWPACALWGLAGACLVVLVAILATLPTWFYGVHKLIGLGPLRVLRVNALAGLASALLAAVLWLVHP